MDIDSETEQSSSSSNGGGLSAAELISQGAVNRMRDVTEMVGEENPMISRARDEHRNRNASRRREEVTATESRNVRQRSEMIPLDINLINSSMMRRSNPITLGELLNPNIVEIKRDGYLDLMLLRSIANGKHGQTNYMVKLINARGANKSNSSNSNYTRLFLFKVMNKNEGDSLVHYQVTLECCTK